MRNRKIPGLNVDLFTNILIFLTIDLKIEHVSDSVLAKIVKLERAFARDAVAQPTYSHVPLEILMQEVFTIGIEPGTDMFGTPCDVEFHGMIFGWPKIRLEAMASNHELIQLETKTILPDFPEKFQYLCHRSTS